MQQRDRVVRRIDQVLEMRASPEVAYPLRARLARAMSEAAHLLRAENPHNTKASVLAQHANRIMQPSEPFDGVWQQEWSRAIEELQELRRSIVPGQQGVDARQQHGL
jgi:hypothetical protein